MKTSANPAAVVATEVGVTEVNLHSLISLMGKIWIIMDPLSDIQIWQVSS